jgi:hypothetical protein
MNNATRRHPSMGATGIGNGRTKIVTRIIVEWLIDAPLAAEDLVCHSCDVRQCVNPAHLFIGTNQDNMTDMVRKGRQASGSRIATARLSEDDVSQIRAAGRNGDKVAEIAIRFGVSPSHVHGILRGRYWTNTAAPLAVAA